MNKFSKLLGAVLLVLFAWAPAFAAGVNINAVTEAANAATCNWNISPNCRVTTAGGALTTLTLSNPVDGNDYILEFDQDSTGRAVTVPTTVVTNNGATQPAPNSAANAVEVWKLVYNSAVPQYTVVSTASAQQVKSLTLAANNMNGTLTFSNNGQIASLLGASTKPTVSSCGTGSASASSTDTAGDVTATGATACTVIFNTAYANKPVCLVTDETTAAGLKVVYSTGVNFAASGLTSGDEFTYICIGK